MQSKYPYILAVLLGLIIPFIPEINPFLVILGVIYFLAGTVFGYVWPKESWRWGLWIAGPAVVLIGLSVVFGGQFEMFLKKDLPILLVALLSSCLGSFISAWARQTRTRVIKK
jgi:hypothetical protein